MTFIVTTAIVLFIVVLVVSYADNTGSNNYLE